MWSIYQGEFFKMNFFFIVKNIFNNVYYFRLYETQVKKIIKVQCMMRAFLARRRIEKSKSNKSEFRYEMQNKISF